MRCARNTWWYTQHLGVVSLSSHAHACCAPGALASCGVRYRTHSPPPPVGRLGTMGEPLRRDKDRVWAKRDVKLPYVTCFRQKTESLFFQIFSVFIAAFSQPHQNLGFVRVCPTNLRRWYVPSPCPSDRIHRQAAAGTAARDPARRLSHGARHATLLPSTALRVQPGQSCRLRKGGRAYVARQPCAVPRR
jgi:hypothetical protein